MFLQSSCGFVSFFDFGQDLGGYRLWNVFRLCQIISLKIIHAYPDQLGKVVMKLKILKGGMLEITIRDWGRGIENVEQARRPMYTTGGSERSGMGFTIMESFTDRLVVRSVPGKGTTVQMRKRIAPRLAVR